MEKYIGKCLDSLLIPEFDQVEVLVINDGSKDRSYEIAHEYADRYPKSIHVVDKNNGNYGSCINTALPLCTGRYVKVLDADDTFDNEVFSKFVQALKNIDEDLILSSAVKINENGEVLKILDVKERTIVNDSLKITLEDAIKEGLWVPTLVMHNYTYKREVFKKVNYTQTEGISFTDNEWICYPMGGVKNICIINIPPMYRYLFGRIGQTVDSSQTQKNIPSYLKIVDRMLNEYDKIKNDRIYSFIIEKSIIGTMLTLFSHILSNPSTKYLGEFKKIDLRILRNLPNVYHSLNNTKYSKILNYSKIKDFRRSNYNPNFQIPKRIQYGVIILNILRNFFKN